MAADTISQIRARKEYEAIRGFYIHFMVYVPVLLLLVVIDKVGGGSTWVHWVGIGWGMGLLAHAHSAFVATPRQMATWEQEQMAKRGEAAEA